MKQPKQFTALPSYFGSKRKLNALIFSTLAQKVPKSKWHELSFYDAFSGSGAVSLSAKLRGFGGIHSNDISDRGQIPLEALIKNNRVKLQLEKLQPVAISTNPHKPGFVETHLTNSVFSIRHARALDSILAVIGETHCKTEKSLLQLLLWKLTARYVAYGTSIGTSNRGCAEALDTGEYHKLNPKRLKDGSFERLLKPTLVDVPKLVKEINGGIFPALGSIDTYQQDVLTLTPTINADIAYFDPPYANTVGYAKELNVLDSVLFGKQMEPLPPSSFTESVGAISTLLDLSKFIPVWVLSYNDKVISLPELIALVKAVDPKREVAGQAIEYTHMAHVSKRKNHELLIIATQKGV